jgi:hypothetical protein
MFGSLHYGLLDAIYLKVLNAYNGKREVASLHTVPSWPFCLLWARLGCAVVDAVQSFGTRVLLPYGVWVSSAIKLNILH